VVQDCVSVLRGKKFYSTYTQKVAAQNTDTMRYYVRGAVDAWLAENKQETWGEAIITKPISVESIHSWRKANPDAFIAAIAE
jgi:hypothetical protein